MSLLSMLGINLPNLPNRTPFDGLVNDGTNPPNVGVSNPLQALLPQLVAATTGQGAQAPEVALPAMAPGTTAPAYDPSGLPPLPASDPMAPVVEAVPVVQTSKPPKPYKDETQQDIKPETRVQLPPDSPQNWPAIRAGIFKGESGGDYDILFDNAQKGPFSGTKLTNMTVDQAIEFSRPDGPYAQWVKQKIGRVATPMGAYQIVGKTLRGVKQDMGLTGNERMTPELQERMGLHIYKTGGTGQWEGYRGPADPNSVKTLASGGGAAPYGPTSNEMTRPSGSQSAIVAPATGRGLNLPEGDYNTALNNPKGGRSRGGGGGAAKSGTGPDAGGGGGARKNDVSPDYKRYQARKNVRHLRGLTPVATIQALENIGKGLRVQGGGKV